MNVNSLCIFFMTARILQLSIISSSITSLPCTEVPAFQLHSWFTAMTKLYFLSSASFSFPDFVWFFAHY